MDSKPKTGAGVPQAEMPEVRIEETNNLRVNRWLVGTVVVLALAVVALGVVLIVESGDETAPTLEGTGFAVRPAKAQEVALVDRFFDAYNHAPVERGTRSLPEWGYDSAVGWVWNAWLMPVGDTQLSRTGPVVELYSPGSYGDPAFPRYLLFKVRESGGFGGTWIAAWDGAEDRLLAWWMI